MIKKIKPVLFPLIARVANCLFLNKHVRILLNKRKVFVVFFHNPTVKYFEKHIQFFYKHGFNFISIQTLEDFINQQLSFDKSSIVIAFDDGWQDNMQLLPIIENYAIPSCFFLNTGEAETRMCNGKEYKVLSRKDMITLSNHPSVSIGAHTHNHKIITQLTAEELEQELRENIHQLQKLTNQPITSLAYPEGRYDDSSIEIVNKSGLKMAFTLKAGYITPEVKMYEIPRFGIIERSFQESICKVSGLWHKLFSKTKL